MSSGGVRACVLSCFSHVWLFLTLPIVACQTPLFMEFSRQESWSELPFPPSGDHLNPDQTCVYPVSGISLSLAPPGKPLRKNAAAFAKSFPLCPTLCDPSDGSPPGSAVPGILQARTLEWVAISFSSAWKWKVKVKSLSRVRLFVTPWTAAHQAPLPMGFSRQEYWGGVPLPSPWERISRYKYWQNPNQRTLSYSSNTSDTVPGNVLLLNGSFTAAAREISFIQQSNLAPDVPTSQKVWELKSQEYWTIQSSGDKHAYSTSLTPREYHTLSSENRNGTISYGSWVVIWANTAMQVYSACSIPDEASSQEMCHASQNQMVKPCKSLIATCNGDSIV